MKSKLLAQSLGALTTTAMLTAASVVPVAAQSNTAGSAATERPNILFIMGDDIGYMQPGIYHRGLMVGETPQYRPDRP